MRINYNVSAMLANNKLANNDNLLSKSLERLSSGLKVNSAKDNPAGLAMAKRMNAQLEGLSVANQSAADGVSIIETADGRLSLCISFSPATCCSWRLTCAVAVFSSSRADVLAADIRTVTCGMSTDGNSVTGIAL